MSKRAKKTGDIRDGRERREAVAITTALASEHLTAKGGIT